MTEIKVTEHKTPDISYEGYRKSVINVLMSYHSHLVVKCGYCGYARMEMLVCSCGFHRVYANEPDEKGNLVEVWSN